jgi:hypothetical protein
MAYSLVLYSFLGVKIDFEKSQRVLGRQGRKMEKGSKGS